MSRRARHYREAERLLEVLSPDNTLAMKVRVLTLWEVQVHARTAPRRPGRGVVAVDARSNWPTVVASAVRRATRYAERLHDSARSGSSMGLRPSMR
jgi:hypothetical protein